MTRPPRLVPDARVEQRLAIAVASYFLHRGGLADCEIVDLSASGARIVTDAELGDGTLIRLTLPTAAPVIARVASFHDGIARLTFADANEFTREELRAFVFGRSE